MIYFKRDGKQVQVIIDSKISGVEKHKFTCCLWNCENEAIAEIMHQYLQDIYSRSIQDTRKWEYERGWREAKAKEKKVQYFNSVLKA